MSQGKWPDELKPGGSEAPASNPCCVRRQGGWDKLDPERQVRVIGEPAGRRRDACRQRAAVRGRHQRRVGEADCRMGAIDGAPSRRTVGDVRCECGGILEAEQVLEEVGVARQAVGERPVVEVLRDRSADAVAGPLGDEVGAVVGDTAVRVHARAVVEGVEVLRHVLGLALCARVLHVAQRISGGAGRVTGLADQPVGRVRHRREHVRERLVQRAALAEVVETRGLLGDRVGELVHDDVGVTTERREDDPVAVAVDHLLAVRPRPIIQRTVVRAPERVVEVDTEVDRRGHLVPGSVVGIATEGGAEVVVGDGRVDVRLVDVWLAERRSRPRCVQAFRGGRRPAPRTEGSPGRSPLLWVSRFLAVCRSLWKRSTSPLVASTNTRQMPSGRSVVTVAFQARCALPSGSTKTSYSASSPAVSSRAGTRRVAVQTAPDSEIAGVVDTETLRAKSPFTARAAPLASRCRTSWPPKTGAPCSAGRSAGELHLRRRACSSSARAGPRGRLPRRRPRTRARNPVRARTQHSPARTRSPAPSCARTCAADTRVGACADPARTRIRQAHEPARLGR